MSNQPVQSSAPWVDDLRKSILAISPEDQARLSDQERANAEYFIQYAQKYKHRICLPLDEDLFVRGLKEELESHDAMFARVPFKSINTVYYLFRNIEDVSILIDFAKKLGVCPTAGSTTH